MNQNEVSKLIKSKGNRKKNNNDAKEIKKKSILQKCCETQKRIDTNTIILIILIIIFFILLIIYLIKEYIRDNTMNIYFRLLQKNVVPNILPSNESTKYSQSLLDEKKICSTNKKFAIIRRKNCIACGLFSYYIIHLGCIINYLKCFGWVRNNF